MEYENRYSEEQASQIIDFALREQNKLPEGDLVKILSDFKVDETIQKEALRKFSKKSKNKLSLERKLKINASDILMLPAAVFAGTSVGAVLTATYGGIYSLLTQSPFLPMLKSGAKYGALFGVGTFLLKEGIDIYQRYNKKED
jgi:hypothetical protein